MNKTVVVSIVALLLNGCTALSNVFPDNSREYQRAETLPELEIPPDLTGGAISDIMAIPNEDNRTYSGEEVDEVPPELPGIRTTPEE